MPILLVQATTAHVNALPEDVYVNTFHFDQGTGDPAEIALAVRDFYTVVNGAESVGSYLASFISRAVGAAQVRVYDLSDPEPRVPIFIEFWDVPAALAATNTIDEAAVCLSYRGTIGSGDVAARMRGRIYVGPLNVAAVETTSNQNSRPTDDLLNDLVLAGSSLISDAAALGATWVVHSTVGAGLDTPVTGGWADNAFDIQRRRGIRPTLRSTFP